MAEKLLIQNFGPIIEVDFDDIRPLTILIGESGSGKSTILKVLSLFRWIYKRVSLRSYLQHAQIKQTGIGFKIQSLLKISGIYEYLNDESVIVYTRDKYVIEMKNKTVNIRFTIAPDDLCLDKVCYISDKRAMVADFIDNKMERKVANYYLQDTIDNFSTAYDVIKQFPMDYLGVEFRVEKANNSPERLKIHGLDSDYSIEMKNASSGIQTVTPLAMIVCYYATKYNAVDSMNSALFKLMADTDMLKEFNSAKNVGEIKKRAVHIMIEEPELSLYPQSQKYLMDYLVKSCYQQEHDYDMTLMIATHSPYIVNYLNLLAGRATKNIDTPYKLNFKDIDAYEISGGFATSLKVDGEKQIFDTRSLSDPISEIYEEYNQFGL
ncbi:AAA family ATPase [Treponema sp.]|uniref:AAA family ATPase n=1 Tax=Treponema sp. TaxID=166 RepID=UPI00388F112E